MRKRLRKKLQRLQLQNRLLAHSYFLETTSARMVTQVPLLTVGASLLHLATGKSVRVEFNKKPDEDVLTTLRGIMTPPTVEQISEFLFQHTFAPKCSDPTIPR